MMGNMNETTQQQQNGKKIKIILFYFLFQMRHV